MVKLSRKEFKSFQCISSLALYLDFLAFYQTKHQTRMKRSMTCCWNLAGFPHANNIVSDFEKANINALATKFPTSFIALCVFHLNQSYYRKIAKSTPKEIPKECVTYFEETSIDKYKVKRQKAIQWQYPIEFCNCHNRVMNDLPCTTNGVEGFHNISFFFKSQQQQQLIQI